MCLLYFTDDYLDIDMKDLSIRFANDISAYCAFGLKVDSISDPDNEFFKTCFKASHFSSWDLLKFLGYYSVPSIMKVCICFDNNKETSLVVLPNFQF